MPAFWNMGGAWLFEHLWEHYRFSGDRQFLASAYPVMKGAAEFVSDWLVEDGKGHLVTAAGNSPENTFQYLEGSGKKQNSGVCMGPTMDLAIARELFRNCVSAAEILGLDAAFRQELNGKLRKLLPFQVGKRGQLQEWPEDLKNPIPSTGTFLTSTACTLITRLHTALPNYWRRQSARWKFAETKAPVGRVPGRSACGRAWKTATTLTNLSAICSSRRSPRPANTAAGA